MSRRRVVAMIVATLMAAPLAPVTPALAQQGSVAVIHTPVSCAIADEVLQLEAAVPSGSTVAAARAYFHSALGSDFYYVEGLREGARYVFNLPRPQFDAGPITYYIEFLPSGRTGEPLVAVVRRASDCEGRPLAAIGPAPSTVFGPGGVIANAPGFGSFVASAAMGSSVAAAGGGGISTGLLIAGAAVLAGAAVTVIVLKDDTVASPSR